MGDAVTGLAVTGMVATQGMGIAIPQEAPVRGTGRWVRIGLIFAAVLAFTYLTLRGLEGVHLFGDEFHSIRNLHLPYGELLGLYDAYGSGVLLPLTQKLSADLLGPGLLSYRLPSWLGGLAGLLLLYPLARRLVGPGPAAISVLALALSPIYCFYSRYGRGYSLATALALAFALALVHLGEPGLSRTRRTQWGALGVLCGGLLPWAHLFAVSSLGALGLAGIAGVEERRDEEGGRPASRGSTMLVVAGALLFCGALYLPALESLGEFYDRKAFSGAGGTFGVGDVVTLLYGHPAPGWAALVLLPVALLWMARRAPRRAVFLACGALGPVVALLLTRPPGLPYAYARYLLPGLPFQCMALAWLFAHAAHRAFPQRASESAILVTSSLVLVALFTQTPLVRVHEATGPFANSNLALAPLPAFDEPWPRRSTFYEIMEDTEEELTLIEAPELWNRSGLLHRNAWLQHGKNIVVGYAWEQRPERVPRGGPYVNLNAPDWRLGVEADYLVFHKEIYQELTNYWAFVWNRVWPEVSEPAKQAFMDAHSQWGFVKERWEPLRAAEARLRSELGPPAYEDAMVVVWALGEG